ncbi:uncharacterized protein [Rhodnius prolixus]|uniref:uncharacterized protein n=1 Tax=Rhodnius prolixus TaxID=13249 RepID=UPI003D18E7DB
MLTGKLLLVTALFNMLLLLSSTCIAHPVSNPQDVEKQMRQTPQTHCLRFRKFDMIRRCRRYRVRRQR